MTVTLVDLVKINVLSTGSGALSLGSAVSGYRGVEALTNGFTYGYSIQQGSNFEYGTGTYLQSTQQLTRAPKASSAGGVALNLQPNAQVAFVALAEDFAGIIGAIALFTSQVASANVAQVTAAVEILAGQFVNVFDNAGTPSCRLADASDPTKFAMGYAPANILAGNLGVICAAGINAAANTATASTVWLSDTTPGGIQTSPPTTSGHLSQELGQSVPGLGIIFQPGTKVTVP